MPTKQPVWDEGFLVGAAYVLYELRYDKSVAGVLLEGFADEFGIGDSGAISRVLQEVFGSSESAVLS